jgi:hypothetical protein
VAVGRGLEHVMRGDHLSMQLWVSPCPSYTLS